MSGKHSRPVWVEINLNNIKHNYKLLRKSVPDEVLICPVVKADAYGHGIIPVSRVLQKLGTDRLAVALPGEGKELREAGFKLPIHVLGEVLPSQVSVLIDQDLIPTVCKMNTAEKLQRLAAKHKIKKKVHVKVDTGMGRIGLYPDQAPAFIKKIRSFNNLQLEGLITHFASADEEDKTYTYEQWSSFQELIDLLEDEGIQIPLHHVGNSAVILDLPEKMYLDMLRPGIMLYGLYPSSAAKENDRFLTGSSLRPVLSWKARIIYLKEVPPGTPISYGTTYITEKKTKVATIPLGYADGFSRLLSNRGQVLVKGQEAPVIGRVCMDQFMVDVTGIKGVQTGDEVTLIGSQGEKKITADDMAAVTETINYEVVCNISDRIPRVHKGDIKDF